MARIWARSWVALASAVLAVAGATPAGAVGLGVSGPAAPDSVSAGSGSPAVAHADLAAVPPSGTQVAGRPLAHTTLGTVFVEDGGVRTAVLSDDGSVSTLVPGFDPASVTKAFGCGTSFVVDNGSFSPVAASAVIAGSIQWRDLVSGSTGSRVPDAGRLLVGATPGGWAEFDLSTNRLVKVNGASQKETEIAPSASFGYGCDATGYAYVELTTDGSAPTAVVHYCTWAGGEAGCVSLAEDPAAYDILAVSEDTVVYESLAFDSGTGQSVFELWRVTQGGSPSLVYSTSDADMTSAAVSASGTAFLQEAGPTDPDPGLAGFTPLAGSATTYPSPGASLPMVVPSSGGPLLATVGFDEGGISSFGPGAPSLVSRWWMPGSPTLVSLTPARILDTRYGVGAPGGILHSGETVPLTVTGVGGVPAAGVDTVVLNVTVTGPLGGGFVTVYPSGTTRPTASNLNYVTNQTVANQVITKVGSDGVVDLYVLTGTQLIADVTGWYPDGAAYRSLAPTRILDTRTGVGAPVGVVPAGGQRDLTVLGAGGVPAAGVDSVVLNLTAVTPSGSGYLTAWPAGQPRPGVSDVDYRRGQTLPGLTIVKVGASGKVSIYTSAGSHILADVVGYFPDGSDFVGLYPSRILDTRTGTGAAKHIVASGGVLTLTVTGAGGVPASGVKAVMLNVTVTGTVGSGYLVVYPTGAVRPNASTLNYLRGDTLGNSVIAKLGADGKVLIYVKTSTNVIADVSGYFTS